MIVEESLVGVPRPFLALFLTLHDPYWGIPNWPVLRPAPKYTTGLHPKPNRCATFPFHTEMSKFLEVKGPSNDFDIRRETEKWATIQRNYCRKISIPDCEQWKLSPFWISHCIPTLTIIYCDSKTRPPFRQVDKANRQPTDVFFWKMKLPLILSQNKIGSKTTASVASYIGLTFYNWGHENINQEWKVALACPWKSVKGKIRNQLNIYRESLQPTRH